MLEESRIVSSKKCCNAWLVVVNAHKLFCKEYHRRFLYFGSKSFTHFEHEFLNCFILLDPGAASRHDRMFVVKVYRKIETSPWALLPNQLQKRLNWLLLISDEEQPGESGVLLHDVVFLVDRHS